MLERLVEQILYASRWLLAPIYLGLSFALLALGIKFFEEVWHLFAHIQGISEADLVLVILAFIDLSLVGGLIVMVMLSGYENFVSEIDMEDESNKLSWLGKLDAGSLKLKVAASIVAISSIHLLRAFMNATEIANDKLMWYVIIHLTFVISAVMMGVLDRLQSHKH